MTQQQRSLNVGEAFARAMGAFENGNSTEARRLARQIAEVRPEFGGAHYLLGIIALDAGQAKRAAQHLASAVGLSPNEPVPRLALARALEELGNINTAILHYRSVLARDSGHAEANARLATLLARGGKADDAVTHCRRALATCPGHAEALNTLGALLHDRGEDAEAAGHLRAALGLRPDWGAALNNYALVLNALGRGEEAMAFLQGAVDLHEDHAGSRINLAAVLRGLGRLAEARVQAERATKLDPRNADGWVELGLVRQRSGHPEGAAAAFERAVALAPDRVHAHWCLAEACRELGEAARAASHYRTCLRLDPSDRHGAALGLALTGAESTPGKAPDAYVRQLFDDYAEEFDAALVDGLAYRAPELLEGALRRLLGPPAGSLDVLDAGCGTGLAGPALKPFARRLEGIDLSPAMVQKAKSRRLYDHLEVGELVESLRARSRACDLVVAADVLVYLGDLDPVMAAVAAALRPGGVFAFTVERDDAILSYRLGPKQRYVHAPAYVQQRAAAAGLEVASMEEAVTRQEAGADVPGLVVLLRLA
jgi:predicted TPR repeat methyltransferase